MKVQSTEVVEDSVSCRRKSLSVFRVLGEKAELRDALIERLKAVKLFVFKGTLTSLHVKICIHDTYEAASSPGHSQLLNVGR